MATITPGIRIRLRGEDFLVTKQLNDIIDAEGISELVHGLRFQFDLSLEDFEVIKPENTEFKADTSPNYRQTKLFLETVFRNSSHYSENIEIAHKAAIRAADYQFQSTIKALALPQARILIADAVGLGKTVQVGIFMAELIRRGKGKKILVVTPKSILAQFQQEIWARFAIPLVRLDSVGIANIKSHIPANKNPFDYYDKVIVSIDTLKNNGKFRHNLEKIHWDIVAIDECHTVANVKSQRGNLAKLLAESTESMVLTSATPHNGKKENFANLISLLDPTAIPYNGEFTKEDIQSLYVRRFKKDVEDEVGDAFRARETIKITCSLRPEEEKVLEIIENFKQEAYEHAQGNMSSAALLFSIGLFKAYMSSPKACLGTVSKRLEKNKEEGIAQNILLELQALLSKITHEKNDSKYIQLLKQFEQLNWKGDKKSKRIIIFSERRDTLNELQSNIIEKFNLDENIVSQFHGSMTDVQQQTMLDDFSKEDSKIRLFLASDAGSQGVNLHYHCHYMINYDIPWSIITLDQRNGRIDRFGQTQTPYIYYLIAESQTEKVQADIRILEKLKEKEEEIYKSLGDAGSVFNIFEKDKEETHIAKAIANSNESLLEKEEQEEDFDFLDLFTNNDDEEEDKIEITKNSGFKSFYSDDFSFYTILIDELKAQDSELKNYFLLDKDEKTLEVIQSKDLSRTGVLYDMPREAFPKTKETFKLTTEAKLVERAIEQARKKQNQWSAFQLLYDLNPIAKWMQNKLLSQIDRGKALVVRMRKPLPENSAHFVFQGISSNGQGKAILSKIFTISKSFNGESLGSLDDFSDFMDEYRLNDSLPTLEIEDQHLDKIKALTKEAVESAKKMYKNQLQGHLDDEMSDKLEIYNKNLNNWIQESEKQLNLAEEEHGIIRNHKEKRRREVKQVQKQREEFYNSYFSLENEPYIRLLAVFFRNIN